MCANACPAPAGHSLTTLPAPVASFVVGSVAGPEKPNDDQLDELPPLDGDSKDAPEADGAFEEPLADLPGEASLDDTTGEGETPDEGELEVDDAEGGWLNEPPDAPDLDLGDVAILELDEEPADATDDTEEPSAADLDVGLADGPERGGLDAGDEGPVDADEELREADLPALDADEEGEVDDAALVDPGFAADEPLGLPWAAKPWSRVGAPVGLTAATAVACTLRGALVAGRGEGGTAELSRVDLEGTCQSLPAPGVDAAAMRAVAVEGDVIAVVVDGGGALVSRDGGASFAPVAEAGSAVEATVAAGRVWLRTRAGGLLVNDRATDPAHRCAVPGTVAAIARVGPALAALVVDDTARPVCLLRSAPAGALASFAREPLAGADSRTPALLAARGQHVAYAARRGVVRRLAGDPARELTWEGRVTSVAFVDDRGTLLVATYSAGDDTTALVCVDCAGAASVVARIGPASGDADADGRVVAMAVDEAHGVVWVAGGFGVAAFALGDTPG
jgi:hypothetical protein